MNFLAKNFKETIQTILNQKKIFIFLLLLQVIIFIIFSITLFSYSIKIISNFETISQIAQQQESTLAQETQLQSALTISTQLSQIIQHLKTLSLILIITYLIGNGLLWSITHRLIDINQTTTYKLKQNLKQHLTHHLNQILKSWLKFTAITLLVLIPYAIIAYYLVINSIETSLAPESFATLLKTLIAIKLILYTFLLYMYAHLNQPTWKTYLTPSLTFIKKIHLILISGMINLTLLGIIVYAIYQTTIYSSLETLSIIITFIFIILLVLTRLYWTITIRNIDTKSTTT
jgi:hypothetical protein